MRQRLAVGPAPLVRLMRCCLQQRCVARQRDLATTPSFAVELPLRVLQTSCAQPMPSVGPLPVLVMWPTSAVARVQPAHKTSSRPMSSFVARPRALVTWLSFAVAPAQAVPWTSSSPPLLCVVLLRAPVIWPTTAPALVLRVRPMMCWRQARSVAARPALVIKTRSAQALRPRVLRISRVPMAPLVRAACAKPESACSGAR